MQFSVSLSSQTTEKANMACLDTLFPCSSKLTRDGEFTRSFLIPSFSFHEGNEDSWLGHKPWVGFLPSSFIDAGVCPMICD